MAPVQAGIRSHHTAREQTRGRTRASDRPFSLAWMLGSFFLIGGGVASCAFALRLLDISDPWYGHAGYYVGAVLGGFTIARASPGITIAEPTLAAFLLTCVLGGFFGLSPGSSLVWPENPGTDLWHRALSLGLVSLLGGLLGSSVGEHVTERYPPADSEWKLWCWQAWMSALAYAGCLLVSWIVILILGQWNRQGLPDTDVLMTLSFVVAALTSGVVAQALNHKRARLSSAAGPLLLMTLAGIAVVAATGEKPHVITFLALSGVALSVLAFSGASLTYPIMQRITGRYAPGSAPPADPVEPPAPAPAS